MTSPWSQTRSGGRFDILDPRPSQVCIGDIASQLAKVCRFGGACTSFYSVAQHSVEVAELLPPELRGYGLLHDAHEMIVGDLTTPVKQAIHAVYHRREPLELLVSRIDEAIFVAFGLDYPMPPSVAREIKHADMTMFATELRDLMVPAAHAWGTLPSPREKRVIPLEWQAAEQEFLHAAAAIFKEIEA